MEIYKTDEGYYTFNKAKYKPPDEIRELYEMKLEILEEQQGKDLPKDIREAYVINDPFGSYLRLRKARKLDPRYPFVLFTGENEAKIAYEFAEKLHKMTDKEFLFSGFPYIFMDKIGTYAFRFIH